MFIENLKLKDNDLIICPNEYKINILSEINSNKLLINIKFMSKEEFLRNYFFDYDYHAIKYIKDNYNYSIENSKIILNNLYYLDDYNYDNSKLEELVKIRRELDNNNLLIYNLLFKEELKKYSIKVVGYGYLEKNELPVNYTNYYYYPYFSNNISDKEFNYYEFNMVEDEIEFVFDNIASLLAKGIDINKIFIINNNSKYNSYLKRFSITYNIPINVDNSDLVLGTIYGKEFKELLELYDNTLDVYNNIKESIYKDDFINLLNKYIDLDYKDLKEFVLNDLKNSKIKNDKLINCINIKELDSIVKEDEYVFIIGFNDSYPKIELDTDYLTNDLINKYNLNKLDTLTRNRNKNKNVCLELKSFNNLYLSYSEKSPFETYFKSNLVDELGLVKKTYISNNTYSNTYNKYKYTYLLDECNKYGEKSINKDLLDTFNSTYNDINYKTYNNKFNGINKDELIEFIHNKLNLSYSSLDNYFRCPFRYYLNNVLKVEPFESTFCQDLGTLFHACLEHKDDINFDLDSFYDNYYNDKELTVKERYFYFKYKDEIKFILDTVKEQKLYQGLDNEKHEQSFYIPISENNPKVGFVGFVDKIMYREKDGMNLISVIDYKTGNPDINIKYIDYGLKMQLPTYMYLIKNSNLFSNPKFMGFYLQKILDTNIKHNPKKSLIDQKKEYLKLQGYTNSDLKYIDVWDSTYENSLFIKSLKLKQDGNFYNYSKVLSDTEIDDIINKTSDKIMEAKDNILNGNFKINIKMINNKNKSCDFCNFKDICYKQESDKEYIVREDIKDDEDKEERDDNNA